MIAGARDNLLTVWVVSSGVRLFAMARGEIVRITAIVSSRVMVIKARIFSPLF